MHSGQVVDKRLSRAVQYKMTRFLLHWFSHLALGLHVDIVLSVEAQEDSVLVTRKPRGLFIHLHGSMET